MSLLRAARTFCEAYQARAGLADGFAGWTKTIALVATDSGAAVAVRIRDGRIVECVAGDGGDVVITADEQTLRDILELKRGPNEPYLFGELLVRGPEEDFLRLDYIASVLEP
jgi:hypothetical protein